MKIEDERIALPGGDVVLLCLAFALGLLVCYIFCRKFGYEIFKNWKKQQINKLRRKNTSLSNLKKITVSAINVTEVEFVDQNEKPKLDLEYLKSNKHL